MNNCWHQKNLTRPARLYYSTKISTTFTGIVFSIVTLKENMGAAALPLKHKDFLHVDKHYEDAAVAAHLLYVKDNEPGITRIKKGKGFAYYLQSKPVKEKKAIDRIHKLVIPCLLYTSIGVDHEILLKNKRLARMVKQCRDIPGKELFQYYDTDGSHKSIDSGMVNQYIHEAAGSDYSAKDFRTWAGSLHALQAFRSLGEAITATENKKNIIAALDEVSKKLGNTRTVCKKYYVHPALLQLYEENNLSGYLTALDKLEEPDDKSGLTAEEQVLMKILKQNI